MGCIGARSPSWRCVSTNAPRKELAFHSDQIKIICKPSFRVGDTVLHEGREVEVIETSREFVVVRFDEFHEVRGGGFIRHRNCNLPIARADLVAENLESILKEKKAWTSLRKFRRSHS